MSYRNTVCYEELNNGSLLNEVDSIYLNTINSIIQDNLIQEVHHNNSISSNQIMSLESQLNSLLNNSHINTNNAGKYQRCSDFINKWSNK